MEFNRAAEAVACEFQLESVGVAVIFSFDRRNLECGIGGVGNLWNQLGHLELIAVVVGESKGHAGKHHGAEVGRHVGDEAGMLYLDDASAGLTVETDGIDRFRGGEVGIIVVAGHRERHCGAGECERIDVGRGFGPGFVFVIVVATGSDCCGEYGQEHQGEVTEKFHVGNIIGLVVRIQCYKEAKAPRRNRRRAA